MDLAGLVDTYCAAWSHADPDERRILLLSVWNQGGTYTDPTVHAEGADELLAHISKVHSSNAGLRIMRTSHLDVHHGVARFAWKLVKADGSSLPEGLDIIFLDPTETRIMRVIGFFGPLKQLPLA